MAYYIVTTYVGITAEVAIRFFLIIQELHKKIKKKITERFYVYKIDRVFYDRYMKNRRVDRFRAPLNKFKDTHRDKIRVRVRVKKAV